MQLQYYLTIPYHNISIIQYNIYPQSSIQILISISISILYYQLLKLKDQQLQPNTQIPNRMHKENQANKIINKSDTKQHNNDKNIPHCQILQLLVQFQVEDYKKLLIQIQQVSIQINKQQQILSKLKYCNLQIQNTGKKNYPRIIIKPDFIATQHVKTYIKQYYQKASNTYLRQDLLRKKHYQNYSKIYQQIKNMYKVLKQKQTGINKQKQLSNKIINDKRLRNLKQELRLRAIKQQQLDIKQIIDEEKLKYKQLLAQYDLKKNNYNNRQKWAGQLVNLIQKQKKNIQQAYNPDAYRNHLKKLSKIRTKNQSINLNLILLTNKSEQIKLKKQTKIQLLEKSGQMFVPGKYFDTPSKKKRQIVQKYNKSAPKYPIFMYNLKKNQLYKTSQFSKQKQSVNQSNRKDKSHTSHTTSLRQTDTSTKDIFQDKSLKSLSMSLELRKNKNLYITSRMFA